jgi:hypothetical protein
MRLLGTPLLLALSGCAAIAAIDRGPMSTFRAADDGRGYVFTAQTGLPYPPDDPAAEATRRQWLRAWLEQNALCPDTYVVDSREGVRTGAHPYAVVLVYRVSCP